MLLAIFWNINFSPELTVSPAASQTRLMSCNHPETSNVCYTHFTPVYRIRRKRLERSFHLADNDNAELEGSFPLSDDDKRYSVYHWPRGKLPSILFLLILYTVLKWVLLQLTDLGWLRTAESVEYYKRNFNQLIIAPIDN